MAKAATTSSTACDRCHSRSQGCEKRGHKTNASETNPGTIEVAGVSDESAGWVTEHSAVLAGGQSYGRAPSAVSARTGHTSGGVSQISAPSPVESKLQYDEGAAASPGRKTRHTSRSMHPKPSSSRHTSSRKSKGPRSHRRRLTG